MAQQVVYKHGWWLKVGVDGERWWLQWRFVGPCSKTGKWQEHSCRKWFLSEHMTDGEFVQTAFAAALQAEEHECREFFLFNGKRVFNPHLSLEALMSRADMEEVRDEQLR